MHSNGQKHARKVMDRNQQWNFNELFRVTNVCEGGLRKGERGWWDIKTETIVFTMPVVQQNVSIFSRRFLARVFRVDVFKYFLFFVILGGGERLNIKCCGPTLHVSDVLDHQVV